MGLNETHVLIARIKPEDRAEVAIGFAQAMSAYSEKPMPTTPTLDDFFTFFPETQGTLCEKTFSAQTRAVCCGHYMGKIGMSYNFTNEELGGRVWFTLRDNGDNIPKDLFWKISNTIYQYVRMQKKVDLVMEVKKTD